MPSFPIFISLVMDTIRLSNLGSIYTSPLGKETIGHSFSVARDVIVTLPSAYDKSKYICWKGARRVLPSGVRDITILCFFDFDKSWYIQLWIGCGYPSLEWILLVTPNQVVDMTFICGQIIYIHETFLLYILFLYYT